MFEIEVTERWHETFPGAHAGVLLVGNMDNARRATPLDQRKREIEARLREMYGAWTRAELQELEILRAYRRYYRRFGKSYHVQLQLESIAHRGKSLPDVSPLVDANFAAELETLVLTAGHDAERLVAPVTLDAALGNEAFTLMDGSVRTPKAGDMMMTDGEGVICTIIYGQDQRTPITPATRRALYVAYAPAGVPAAAVQQQLDTIRDHILLFAPDVAIELSEVYAAGSG